MNSRGSNTAAMARVKEQCFWFVPVVVMEAKDLFFSFGMAGGNLARGEQ